MSADGEPRPVGGDPRLPPSREISPSATPLAGRDDEAGFGEQRSGRLGVRVAASEAEIDAGQALRYRVFYEEMGALPDDEARRTRRDRDEFDAVADHLVVVDHALGEGPESVIGTYRLIRRAAADRIGRFYSASEYDLAPLLAFPGEVLELGRSCIATGYRQGKAMQLMWRGIAAYVFKHRIDLMFGCASLPGTDPDALAPVLTYLRAQHLAPPALRPRALPELYVPMDRLDPATLDMRAVTAELPPLVKGYLRLGGFVGDGAVIDRQFNTTDVCVLVKTDLVTESYYKHYERRIAQGSAEEAG
ncbi:GNAT family N-acetyltransferase [Roseomonas sp. NAR14]|uniref:L-ornithine N(alpha)-acyltransferase n=1 Tax=Roseomonas acroporae TaxID=2937791 RepID=A0A9X2BS56_9PROT|nr:GNAT family N-acyltransferase [Roseomonas acroporae]MCK8783253.1 GNAT family N-acetyltransferase [Roseomonas acroporae]